MSNSVKDFYIDRLLEAGIHREPATFTLRYLSISPVQRASQAVFLSNRLHPSTFLSQLPSVLRAMQACRLPLQLITLMNVNLIGYFLYNPQSCVISQSLLAQIVWQFSFCSRAQALFSFFLLFTWPNIIRFLFFLSSTFLLPRLM